MSNMDLGGGSDFTITSIAFRGPIVEVTYQEHREQSDVSTMTRSLIFETYDYDGDIADVTLEIKDLVDKVLVDARRAAHREGKSPAERIASGDL